MKLQTLANLLYILAESQDEIIKKYKLDKDIGHGFGYSSETDTWYGWSHRAICGFKKGDKIFDPNYGDEKTKFTQHGSKTIKTYEDG